MRVDAHQHFWHYTEREYAWITPEMAPLRQDRLPRDLAPLLQEAGFDGSVAVQARRTLEETRWLLELSDQYPFIRGVVGWVDLCGPRVRQDLERFAAHPRFKGVRHVIQNDPNDRFILREDFRRGVALLAEFGLTYDILIFPRHLPNACEFVRAFPDQPFVLDHLAKPSIKKGTVSPWAADLRRLGSYDNVFCKISGMVTEADWRAWKPADFVPYLEVALEAFGPRRLMLGSDWPVCTAAGSYADVMRIPQETIIAALSEDERGAICGGTAERFYKLAS